MSSLAPHGVLVVDKPKGPTSHDVVRVMRRALRTRAIGHAGTLDPMATGVLVIGVGEGTKLLNHLSADDKTYLATVTLGSETDSLDAEGSVTRSEPVPSLTEAQVAQAATAFLGETLQRAPAVSAIKQGGVALHERVRRGEIVVPPERSVVVHALDVLDVRGREIDLRVHCGKGFYVRSLARDLALTLGTVGHLSALRRVASGSFVIEEALEFSQIEAAQRDDAKAALLREKLLPLAAALRGVPRVRIDAQGVVDVRHGRAFPRERLLDGDGAWPADGTELVAVLDADGVLVSLGCARDGAVYVVRGIQPP